MQQQATGGYPLSCTAVRCTHAHSQVVVVVVVVAVVVVVVVVQVVVLVVLVLPQRRRCSFQVRTFRSLGLQLRLCHPSRPLDSLKMRKDPLPPGLCVLQHLQTHKSIKGQLVQRRKGFQFSAYHDFVMRTTRTPHSTWSRMLKVGQYTVGLSPSSFLFTMMQYTVYPRIQFYSSHAGPRLTQPQENSCA